MLYFAFGLHKFSENRIFTDADDYRMEIELPLADCPQNLDIFANALNSTEKMTKELNELGILE
ncbi:MAG: hypothetical protein IJG42_10740 [Muribaculaceae bacterium]|nr:hypothetical protein [Muribaculaceae bacterium]